MSPEAKKKEAYVNTELMVILNASVELYTLTQPAKIIDTADTGDESEWKSDVFAHIIIKNSSDIVFFHEIFYCSF